MCEAKIVFFMRLELEVIFASNCTRAEEQKNIFIIRFVLDICDYP